MSDFFLLLISALAVFRLSELVAYDKGPFSIFKRIRDLFPQDSLIDEMLECIYCNGIWWSLLLTVFYTIVGAIKLWAAPIWWLGIAGGAITIFRVIRRRE